MNKLLLSKWGTAIILAAGLVTGCGKDEDIITSTTTQEPPRPKSSLYMLFGDHSNCYTVWGPSCGTLTCSNSKAVFDWNGTTTFGCGDLTFTKGANNSSYGPWYTFFPQGQSGTYEKLKVRFRGDFHTSGNDYVGFYSYITKQWTIQTGNGTTFEATRITNPGENPC